MSTATAAATGAATTTTAGDMFAEASGHTQAVLCYILRRMSNRVFCVIVEASDHARADPFSVMFRAVSVRLCVCMFCFHCPGREVFKVRSLFVELYPHEVLQ